MKKFDEVVPDLLEMFRHEDFPQQLALTVIRRSSPDLANKPSDKWSITNQLIQFFVGQTRDARTYKQWQAASRQVVKGAKSFAIIAPIIKKLHDDEKDEDEAKIIGFRALPVFAIENTIGEGIPEDDYTPAQLPPFYTAAEKLGIRVSWKPIEANAYGYYSLRSNSITLHSQDYCVFLHELAHAIQNRIEGLAGVPGDKAEIIAELSAAVLCEMQGITGYQQQSYEYIQSFVKGKDPKATMKAIADVLSTVEQIVNVVIKASTEA